MGASLKVLSITTCYRNRRLWHGNDFHDVSASSVGITWIVQVPEGRTLTLEIKSLLARAWHALTPRQFADGWKVGRASDAAGYWSNSCSNAGNRPKQSLVLSGAPQDSQRDS